MAAVFQNVGTHPSPAGRGDGGEGEIPAQIDWRLHNLRNLHKPWLGASLNINEGNFAAQYVLLDSLSRWMETSKQEEFAHEVQQTRSFLWRL